MKTFILSILLLILYCPAFYGQNNKEDNSQFSHYSSSLFNSKETAMSVVSVLDKKEQNELNSKIQPGVQIQQIGDLNKVKANLQSNETKVSVDQKGNVNELLLDKKAKTITQNMIQKGNNNKISDFTLNTNYNVNMEMIQKGDNQNIQNIGTNSLSKNMKITQTGNGASIILINK
ncbi:hypothetical protein [Flavobacterium johnsoniae]|uniref:Curlin associated repeat-containing protein n=1 Tax=Flavobacterium johnsoniae (strain ATCC 17061 / DSM 2064 / JCM 8514 / BCRC 14874 / CCUG 350202 / NBRC 14942 / NCIMB 11054 / UW101) TaxID=376686 RepID=A5FHE4_FLAJ1|nr:hypothetical protein [Flavobacterium johnsoniae]ABQ05374.1 hypothetical protein Fjoh_2347 [Flavobacterium johnsoniae UW101]OXE96885.1 hypothetical protein B0A63_20530 [Flavobacterium johnsoniae UW101]WQG82822.1 hypothetical protein SR927_06800 [Flavobacterium johnsoniae UW101]SHL58437.1 hypothetical protein SAMN05444146_4127 [Flavobacterium johnsoniae]